MGLTARQQRVLDAIEHSLRSGEPHLVSMFAIFGRLTHGELRPRREQLPDRSWLADHCDALARRRARARQLRTRVPAMRRPVARLLFIGQLMAILAVLGVLIGLGSSMTPAACTTRTATTHGAAATPRAFSPVLVSPACLGQPAK